MQSWRRRHGLYLLLHSLLFSIPCALAGLLGSLLFLWVWAHGARRTAVTTAHFLHCLRCGVCSL